MKKFSDLIKIHEDYARLLLESEDYRAFLKCFFGIKKVFNPVYSYGIFALHADVSKSAPRDITEGLRSLTDKTLPKFLKAMELEGLMEEFFVQLVAADTDPAKKRIVQRLKDLYLETHFNKTYTDSNFQDFRSPFIYAASGEVGVGVKLQTLAKRTGLSVEQIKETLPLMEELRLGSYKEGEKTFTPSTSQVHITADKDKKHFIDFYLYCMGLQKENLESKFHSETALFYNEVFSVKASELPALKGELKKVLKSFMLKAENPNGDRVAVLNLGFFDQVFNQDTDKSG
ncbi:MAG TPA: TIGR02147 family protein [Bacteriovoracaceae bacterium]|nr:TIGR02147 family protein [Bacteriovoracaceae bacterium]